MFSENEFKAINEKIGQLRKIQDGILSPQELADLITKRRVSWLEENKEYVFSKYNGLPDDEKAWRIIFLDNMKINPEHSKMVRINDRKIRIESYNFCPYLEACKEIGLDKFDTLYVCKEIGEPSIQRMCEMINPDLRFSRNYQNIRPQNHVFCEEYIEIL
jgi:hypothetical protein